MAKATIRRYLCENLRQSFAVWDVGVRMGALIGAILALIPLVIIMLGYVLVFEPQTWRPSELGWWAMGGLWFASLVILVTPYRMWRAERIDKNKLEERLRPAIFIEYDDADPACNKQLRFTDGHNGRSIRFRLLNVSDANVERVQAYLVRIEFRSVDEATFKQIPYYEPLPLEWSMERRNKFSPATLHPRLRKFVGLGRTYDNQNLFRLWVEHLSGITPPINQIGDYKFFLQVVGEEMPTSDAVMVVTWNGKWDEITACLVEST